MPPCARALAPRGAFVTRRGDRAGEAARSGVVGARVRHRAPPTRVALLRVLSVLVGIMTIILLRRLLSSVTRFRSEFSMYNVLTLCKTFTGSPHTAHCECDTL